jgi:hypothetical protein
MKNKFLFICFVCDSIAFVVFIICVINNLNINNLSLILTGYNTLLLSSLVLHHI